MPDGINNRSRTLAPDGETHLNPGLHRRLQSIRLLIETGPDKGLEMTFDRGMLRHGRDRITGGRKETNDIVISHNSASSRHFELRFEEHSMRLNDKGSRNGTFVGSARVNEAWLTPGSSFSPAGHCEIRLVDATEAEVPIFGEDHFGPLYGASPGMREIFLNIQRFASTPLSVLIHGETGTGKELVARALHERSNRSQEKLVVFDSTTVPKDLAESQILGHSRGAFTGATTTREGLFEQADKGTLFIDEIGDLPMDLQPKLLRVLETQEVTRVGESTPRKIDVRFVAATHRDLEQMVAEGRFRQDLYYRLAELTIHLPSLRERGNDVVGLAEQFLRETVEEQGRKQRLRLAEPVRPWLKREQWPGNVRQLRNVIRRAAYLTSEVIEIEDLAMHWKSGRYQNPVNDRLLSLPLAEAKNEFCYQYVQHQLAVTGGNVAEVARRAGYSEQGIRNIRNREPGDAGT